MEARRGLRSAPPAAPKLRILDPQVPSEPQKTVSEQEGLLVRADVKEVISGFSSVFVFLWAVLTLLLLFLIYQVATFGYGLAFPAVDPLAF